MNSKSEQRANPNCGFHEGIIWLFNPPAGWHYRGVWERQIRTLRWILQCTSKCYMMKGFDTLLGKKKAINNNRSITKASHEPVDLDRENQAVSVDNDYYSKGGWRQVQCMYMCFEEDGQDTNGLRRHKTSTKVMSL